MQITSISLISHSRIVAVLVDKVFNENHDHEQEALFSPVKDLPPGIKTKLDQHWSSNFYEHVFTQIDEEKFAVLYHDGYSRPNKPVNELVSLEIIKALLGLSDEELEHAYLFDFRVRTALGKETLGDNICPKTFTNFRRRVLEFEEQTGRDLLHELFTEHRDYLQAEFDIDATTQRMDSTFIDGNIKHLSRIDLIATVVHNFLAELPDERVTDLPAGMARFAVQENLELSYTVPPGEGRGTLETLAEHAAWLVEHFEDEPEYSELERFSHLERVLDEQCYRIPELEEHEDDEEDVDDDDDDDSPGWEPVRKFTTRTDESGEEELRPDRPEDEAADENQDRVELKDAEEIDSDSLQNPHDDEATFRRKHTSEHVGYVANLAETCGGDDPFRLITAVRVATNNTDDGDLLDENVDDLAAMGLADLLTDGGYTHKAAEAHCSEQGITQHFTGIKGTPPPEETLSLAEFDWDGHELLACPAGREPLEQRYKEDSGRFSFRMAKEHCEGCEYRENCYVEEKQTFYSYGFWERKLAIAKRRARLSDPACKAFLNQRAGAESMINEVYHKTGDRTKFTGRIKVKNASIATAIGTNLKRVSRHLTEDSVPSKPAA